MPKFVFIQWTFVVFSFSAFAKGEKWVNDCNVNDPNFASDSVFDWPKACKAYDYTRRRDGSVRKMTQCLQFVKWHLLREGLISEYPIQNRAFDYRLGLESAGFKKWPKKFRGFKLGNHVPFQNLVCVFSGGRAGHIEVYVKEGDRQGWFWGPYQKDLSTEAIGNPDKDVLFTYPMNHSSRMGRRRPLHSCWYKGKEARRHANSILSWIRKDGVRRRLAAGKCRSRHPSPSVKPAADRPKWCFEKSYKGQTKEICGYAKSEKQKNWKKVAIQNRFLAFKEWQASVDCAIRKQEVFANLQRDLEKESHSHGYWLKNFFRINNINPGMNRYE